MSTLINGRIPAKSECPYRDSCEFAKNGNCGHRGKDHVVDYSCATARLFQIIERPRAVRLEKK